MDANATKQGRRKGWLGERGSAMAELAVLLPVYLTLTVGVVILGRLVIARQQVVEAARFVSWSFGELSGPDGQRRRPPPTPDRIKQLFFADRFESAAVNVQILRNDPPVGFSEGELRQAVTDRLAGNNPELNPDQRDLRLASLILQNRGVNGGDPWLRENKVRVTISYGVGDFLLGPNVVQTGSQATCTLITRSGARRDAFGEDPFPERQRRHPIERFPVDQNGNPAGGQILFPDFQPSWDGWKPEFEPTGWRAADF